MEVVCIKKQLKNYMVRFLNTEVADKEKAEMLKKAGFKKADNKALLVYALFNKAAASDVSAFREIKALIGEDENAESEGVVIIDDI